MWQALPAQVLGCKGGHSATVPWLKEARALWETKKGAYLRVLGYERAS